MRLPRAAFPGLACVVLLSTSIAAAQAGDARATKLAREAMEEDYLATNMDAAVAKLKKAIDSCAKSKCSTGVLAQLHGNLGTVYSAGMARPGEAVEAFKKMLELDPKAKPDPSYLTGDVQRAFDEAKSGGTAEPKPPPKKGLPKLTEDPWKEQAVLHSIPVYVELPEGLEASSVTVRYRTPGSEDWKETRLKAHREGWGGYIPCTETQRPGKLSYFVTAFDGNLDRIASSGSAGSPNVVELKESISSRQPALPDEVPPSPCPRPVDALSCDVDDDCPGTQVCQALSCVDASERPAAPGDARKSNWFSLSFSPDLMVVDSTDDACSPAAQDSGKLSCFFSGGVPYVGQPIESGNTNTVQGGVGIGSMRVMLGYDRLLGTRMTAGLRLGLAFLGHPSRPDGKSFLPVHAEGRFAFFFSNDPFVATGVRPYAYANLGAAQASARVNTTVSEDRGGEIENYKLDVYQTGGPFFGGAGLGIHYAVSTDLAMVVEVAGRALLPEFAVVIAPTLGFTYGL